MPTGDKLFRFLARLMLDRFYGTVTIRLETGKVTHVTTETKRTWEYRNLPAPTAETDAREDLSRSRNPCSDDEPG